ncbi:MAG: acyltransferase family protein, partial [Ilyomonas sp.]
MRTFRIRTNAFISKAFNLPVIEKSRLPWVDYLRGISILLVVYRHVLLGIERSGVYVSSYLMTANMIFYSFRIPLFFILSGIFLNMSLKKRSIKQYISNKFETLLYPYFIWATLQITIQIFMSSFTNAQRTWIDYSYLFYQPRELDQFWYLPALFNVSMFYSLIKHYFKPTIFIQIVLGLVFYFLSSHVQQISILSDWMLFYFFFALGDLVSKLFFKDNFQKVLKSPFTFLAVIPLFILTQMYFINHDIDSTSTDFYIQSQFIIIAVIGCFSMFVVAFLVQRLNILTF